MLKAFSHPISLLSPEEKKNDISIHKSEIGLDSKVSSFTE